MRMLSAVLGLLLSAAVHADPPQLTLKTIDGKDWTLADQRGQWVVVNFWATWCAPCIKEMPELSALDEARADVTVIGLAYEEIEVADMQKFLERRPVSYPVGIVDVYAPPADFPAPKGLPTTWLIAPDGEVANRFLGPVSRKDLENAVAAAQASGTGS